MRISPDQRRSIDEATCDLVGAGAHVRLFVSQWRDDVWGGDIDLLVESPVPLDRPVWLAARLKARLQRRLGDRRIDVLFIGPRAVLEPVHTAALAEGVRLS